MRPIFRLSLMLLALFLVIAPAMTFAQTTGTSGSSTTTTTGPATTGGAATAPNAGSATTTDKSTSTDGTTTTSTSTSNIPWLWIVVGAIVIIGIVGVVAASNRSDGTTTRIIN